MPNSRNRRMCRVFNIIVLFIGISLSSYGQQTHPSLILTKEGVDMIKASKTYPALYQLSYDNAVANVQKELEKGIDVPIPKDMAGGYTHERHKLNYKTMQQAGFLYQISGEEKYAKYIKEMLFLYADMFPGLPIHPTDRSYSTGKIFWQCLNDANWLVYTSQAYDCVYDYMDEKERTYLEENLFKPYADFISIENPKFFNRVHNHSTWGNAAVGMIALVMHDEQRLQSALYGLQLQDRNMLEKDNDGGFIYEGEKAEAGFFAQMDYAFSPDGYYTEGPYYQRYAMTPFMLFAMALENKRPDLKIFEYRDSILLKAVSTLINQTDKEGQFFPINDAQKGMSVKAFSVVSAVDIYYFITQDVQLLSIAEQQGELRLDQSGFMVAKAIEDGKTEEFNKASIELGDGADGKKGALGILRESNSQDEEICVVFKYTSQGLGHGHYDKLSYLIYDDATEVLQDYGAARWVNVDQKAGGRYLKENKTWAKQSIAHNTLVVDGKSHFNGKYDIAKNKHSDPHYFNGKCKEAKIAIAKDVDAYPGIEMKRAVILWKNEEFIKPLVIDVMSAFSDDVHRYELPFHYSEHLMKSSFGYEKNDTLEAMGSAHGYQHIFKEASAVIDDEQMQMNWFNDRKFFTLTSITEKEDEAIFAMIGANDPEFHLRKDALMIHRKNEAKNPIFLSVIESHGKYSPVSEIPLGPYTSIKKLELLSHSREYTIFSLTAVNGKSWDFMIANMDVEENKIHEVKVGETLYSWEGVYKISKK